MATGLSPLDPTPVRPAPARVRFTLWELFVLTTLVCLSGGLLTWTLKGDGQAGILFLAVAFGTVAYFMYLVTRWSAGTVVVNTAVLGFVGLCLLLPITRGIGVPRTPERRLACANNLQNVMLALLQYETVYGRFPPAYIADEQGKPIHSWRVFLLPYLEKQELYARYRFDEPWDGPNNSLLHNERVRIFTCPSDISAGTNTSYVAVVGPETMWPGSKALSLTDVINKDGASNTIMFIEVHNSGIHWMEPRDLDFAQMAMTLNSKSAPSVSSGHEGGANVVFADGRFKFLPDSTPPKTLRAALTRAGGETFEWP